MQACHAHEVHLLLKRDSKMIVRRLLEMFEDVHGLQVNAKTSRVDAWKKFLDTTEGQGIRKCVRDKFQKTNSYKIASAADAMFRMGNNQAHSYSYPVDFDKKQRVVIIALPLETDAMHVQLLECVVARILPSTKIVVR